MAASDAAVSLQHGEPAGVCQQQAHACLGPSTGSQAAQGGPLVGMEPGQVLQTNLCSVWAFGRIQPLPGFQPSPAGT